MKRSLAQLILPIKIENSSERVTSLGGLVVLEELARGVRLWEEVDRAPYFSPMGSIASRTRLVMSWRSRRQCGTHRGWGKKGQIQFF